MKTSILLSAILSLFAVSAAHAAEDAAKEVKKEETTTTTTTTETPAGEQPVAPKE
jgi:hypothetical protein